jgi:hypothetical protein
MGGYTIWWQATEPPYFWVPDGKVFRTRREAVLEAREFRRMWPDDTGASVVLPQGERPDRLPDPTAGMWQDTGGEG